MLKVVLLLVAALVAGCRNDSTGPDADPPAVIAHRGASRDAPEHTLAAYDLALAQGADYLELDIARTRDNVLVVIHDSSGDRTLRGTGCSGDIRARSFAELAQCDAGTWFNELYPAMAKAEYSGARIQRLEEVLARYAGRARFYIEIKDPSLYPGIEGNVASALASNGIQPGRVDRLPRVYIQSFDPESLKRMKAIAPGFPRILLTEAATASQLRSILPSVSAFAHGIGPTKDILDEALVDQAHQMCLLVHPYTVDDPAEMQSLLAMGVDGIFSNRPDLLRSVVEALPANRPAFCLPE